MLRVLIIEDEVPAATRLEGLLEESNQAVSIVACLESVEQAVKWLSENQADLIFSDIHLSDGLCFNIFEQIKVDVPVIFTTAYDQYAIKAFQVNSVGYLLKPFDLAELEEVLSKFNTYFNPAEKDIRSLAQALKQEKPDYRKRFLVYSGDKIRTVDVSDAAYFYADQKLVFLMDVHGKRHTVDQTLDKLENQLQPEQFFRINRQYIISYSAIDSMQAYSKGRVKIDLKPEAPKEAIVSIDRAGRFKLWLNQ